jgi:hypothetical protein
MNYFWSSPIQFLIGERLADPPILHFGVQASCHFWLSEIFASPIVLLCPCPSGRRFSHHRISAANRLLALNFVFFHYPHVV